MSREASAVRRLSGEDAIFVYAETQSMPMHTMGTMILDPSEVPGGFGYPQVVDTIEARIHRIPPFRQRLLEIPLGLGHPLLVDDPGFRLENHLHRVGVPAPGTIRELALVVGDLAGRPLERSQPLWEMWVVEGLEGGRMAIVTKLHHCMLDGASGATQMAQLLDLQPGAVPSPAPRWDPPPLPTPFARARASLGSRLVDPRALGRLAFQTVRGALRRRRVEQDLGRDEPLASWFAGEDGPFGGSLTTHRCVAYGSAALDDVKRIKAAFDVTVNDVVLAACALSVRRYLERRKELPKHPVRCAVPVSMKSDVEKTEFSNKVSMMSMSLPMRGDPEEVVHAVRRETQDAKKVFAATEGDLVSQWLELAPPLLTTYGARLFSALHLADRLPSATDLVVSNVKGPPIPLYFGGARVLAIYPMGPVGEGVGLNITVLSNMGRVDIGVMACREVIPDPEEIAEGFGDAVAELLRVAQKKAERPAHARTGRRRSRRS
jgi:diacylglycerol O-acyltransferase / wax synthase